MLLNSALTVNNKIQPPTLPGFRSPEFPNDRPVNGPIATMVPDKLCPSVDELKSSLNEQHLLEM